MFTICCSRSFGEPVTEYKPMQMAMSCYLMNAVEKMRHYRLAARSLTVFIETNKFQLENLYANSYAHKSVYPSDNLFELQHWACNSIEKIYRENFVYKNAGVTLGGLIPAEGIKPRLYDVPNPRHERLNRAIDEINKKFGKETVHLAIAHIGKWQMERERMSPRCTTRIDDIFKIH